MKFYKFKGMNDTERKAWLAHQCAQVVPAGERPDPGVSDSENAFRLKKLKLERENRFKELEELSHKRATLCPVLGKVFSRDEPVGIDEERLSPYERRKLGYFVAEGLLVSSEPPVKKGK